MTNILDKVSAVLGGSSVFKGYLPDKPDTATGVYEYDAVPPEHSFGSTNFVHGLQVRTRALDAATAHHMAESAANVLNRYHDAEISALQVSSVIDIGRDGSNPPRQEYTVNFTIRRK